MKPFFYQHALGRNFHGALFSLILITGCSTVMTKPYPGLREGDVITNTFPLKFKEHAFSSRCYNTIGCKVLYANVYDTIHEKDEVSPPPPTNYPNNLNGSGGIIGIINFPPPAIVTWRSLDGVAHEAKIDIGSIFRDQHVLHHVPEQDIPTETAAFSGVDIILVVNDRTINVYMKTTIALKAPRNPSNPLSNSVHETNLAYSHTY